ncbi:HSP20-like chaperone [Arabidopsis thaliana x Arabidopsis arenosa]|uniref:HSP20-like chaperone n=1 Tax=Arabidopsis thaliana x Arabidopsis arenosa TaxID=1240361 RepID=A0A8T1XF21_9BRAS|nr:HSP20-like chaperone [Arabidopsis thaliana x Arabidopsis arenosa]
MGEPKVEFRDMSRIPKVREGFYATNNQFQKAGPKGFVQVKVLENDNLYVRVDLPGVPDDAVHHRVDAVRQKVVFFSGETLNPKEGGIREYSGTAGLGCDCCEITGVVDAKMKDGVLRMILSRVKVNKDQHNNKCTLTVPPFTGQSGIRLEDHPCLVNGRKGALFGKATAGGGAFFAVDLPGVSPDDVEVSANENEIRFRAEIKNVYEHDESSRTYLGSVQSPFPSLISNNTIAWDAEFGVLRIAVVTPGDMTIINNKRSPIE